ncbi:hypothetical protein [Methyloraptor flagellatus]|uniref:Translocation/assembly module TamB n=1 Tax=Methyloraptor flagellatus TaxID=3162530 RepID=A0AAU7X6M3_9HYPH
MPLPFTDGTVDGVRLAIDYGEAAAWKATVRADGFESADAKLGSAALEASGVARNLADPAARSLSFTLSGAIAGLQAGDAAKAFRDPIRIAGRGNWRAGAATLVEGFSISDGNASIAFDGTLGLSAVTGAARIGVKDLAPFAALADRPLHGATALTATGRYEPIGGAFDLALDGMTTDLAAGLGRADALLGGRLALKGRVARATDGLHFDAVRLGNGRIQASVAGLFGRWTSDLAINAAIADVGVATDRAKGRVALDARVTGASEKPTVAARIAGSNLVLQGRPFRDAALRFDGTVAQGEVDGIVALGGDLGGRPVTGQARLTSLADGGQAIEALIFRVGRSTISGDVTIDEAGLADGALAITSPDLGEVAPLVLMTAAGSVDAKIGLSRANGRQDVKAKGTAKGVKIEAISIASADFDLSAQDLRGRPAITGTATARTIATPAATVAKVDARATPDPNGATRFDVTADGIAPTALRNAGIGALTARARGTLAERLLRFDAEATAGGGIRLTAGGAAAIDGASLDVAVKGNLPLAAANGFLRDRATRLAGTATLDLRVTGSAAEPRPAGTVTIGGFTLADPETGFRLANGQGRIRLGDGRATVESFSATTGRTGTIAVSGTVGLPPADGFPADLTIRLARSTSPTATC